MDTFLQFSIKHTLWVLIRIASASQFNICFYGWMEELMFYVPSTVFQSFRDNMFLWRTIENYQLIITKYPPYGLSVSLISVCRLFQEIDTRFCIPPL